MNERILKAIKDFEKAQKAHTIAAKAKKATQEDARRAWDAVPHGDFKKDRESQAYKEAMNASERESAANKVEKIALAVLMATSQNVATTAANVIREAIQADPETWKKTPTHYKKFSAMVEAITGEQFYYTADYNTVYLYFRNGSHGHNSAYITNQTDAHEINTNLENMTPASEADYKTILKEAKQAQKDAEKLRKAYEALQEKEKAIDATYTSAIRYYLPHIAPAGIVDDYRLF